MKHVIKRATEASGTKEWEFKEDGDGEITMFCNGYVVARIKNDGIICMFSHAGNAGLALDANGYWKVRTY